MTRISYTHKDVQCNRCGYTVSAPNHQKRECDRRLRALGWRIDKFEDICPKCNTGQEPLSLVGDVDEDNRMETEAASEAHDTAYFGSDG